jgi:hypothetical protein
VNCASAWANHTAGRFAQNSGSMATLDISADSFLHVMECFHRTLKPCKPTLDRGASPGSSQHPHRILSRSASIFSSARVRRTTKNSRRATEHYRTPSGTRAPQHTAVSAHGSSQTSSGNTPRQSRYICAQGPLQMHTSSSIRIQRTGLWRSLTAFLIISKRDITTGHGGKREWVSQPSTHLDF